MASSLTSYQISSDTNEFTQERSRIHVSIVKDALANQEIARNMNELTQERSRTNAGIV